MHRLITGWLGVFSAVLKEYHLVYFEVPGDGLIGCMMVQLQFDACVFSGIVCRECRVALDAVDLCASKLKRHGEEQHNNMELVHQHEFARLTEIMEKCASSLLGFTTDAEKAKFCQMSRSY